ncbi:MAG: OB-fold nucleic acid binding domain-containing protein [Thermoplasmatales archaeon]
MEELTKVKDLNSGSKRVTVLAKVLSVGEPREIQTRYGEKKNVTEAVLGDETGKVTMSLWEDQAKQVENGSSIRVENGYVSFVRGHMRLNVGKYGSIKKADSEINEVNESLDMSEKEYSREEIGRRPGRSFNNNRSYRSRF